MTTEYTEFAEKTVKEIESTLATPRVLASRVQTSKATAQQVNILEDVALKLGQVEGAWAYRCPSLIALMEGAQ